MEKKHTDQERRRHFLSSLRSTHLPSLSTRDLTAAQLPGGFVDSESTKVLGVIFGTKIFQVSNGGYLIHFQLLGFPEQVR